MLARTITLTAAAFLTIGFHLPAQEPKPEPAGDAIDAVKKQDGADEAEEINLRDFIYTTDEAIERFRDRLEKFPNDDVTHQRLGEMYERKAQQTGDLSWYEKAEAELRKSLELSPENHRAQVSLAAVLCTRHKFAEGLELARKALKKKPKDIDALATAGDALQETGRYDEAEAAFRELHRISKLPPVLSRLAGLAEFRGDPDEALRLMKQAADDVIKSGGTAKDAGWYRARMGDIALTAGRVDEAESHYASVPPGIDAYHDATAGLGRILAMKGKNEEAIDLYEKAVAIGPDPHMLAALGDLYIKTGKPERAEPLFDRILKATEGRGEYLRERAMFLANHDRDLPQALKLAEEDFRQRKDVYGYDALAWTLYKNGRVEEASRAMDDALKLGTRDASLFFHAGMIHLRLGERAKARDDLEKALRLNPRFSPTFADEARKALDGLDGPGANPVRSGTN